MSKVAEPFTLPPSPKGLCFDKNQFLGVSNFEDSINNLTKSLSASFI